MEVNLKTNVSLQEAEELILAVGNENAIHLVGEPGVGKTAMFDRIVEKTGFRGVYIDVPTVELGELGIPMPNHETKTTGLYPNEAWGFHTGEPLVVFCDEFSKPSSQAVVNTLHPMLNERRIANFKLHKDTIVITAGNFNTDGVGDKMMSHSINRITRVEVRKPYADEWIEWGSLNEIAPEVLAFVRRYEQCMASYRDGNQSENPYIFNPKTPQLSFVSPRSLHKASNIIKKRGRITRNAAIASLSGTIGEAAARDMLAYLEVSDSMPTWEEIMADPKGCKLPNSAAALSIMAFGAMQKIDRGNIGKWFEYLKRTPKELQSVFCLGTVKIPEKKQILLTSGAFVNWMRENQYLF